MKKIEAGFFDTLIDLTDHVLKNNSNCKKIYKKQAYAIISRRMRFNKSMIDEILDELDRRGKIKRNRNQIIELL
jgi:hypothetical protein